MDIIITADSFQFLGDAEALKEWESDKYQAWYAMPWNEPDALQAKEDYRRLFARMAYLFHKQISSSRDINYLRDQVTWSFEMSDLKHKVSSQRLCGKKY